MIWRRSRDAYKSLPSVAMTCSEEEEEEDINLVRDHPASRNKERRLELSADDAIFETLTLQQGKAAPRISRTYTYMRMWRAPIQHA